MQENNNYNFEVVATVGGGWPIARATRAQYSDHCNNGKSQKNIMFRCLIFPISTRSYTPSPEGAQGYVSGKLPLSAIIQLAPSRSGNQKSTPFGYQWVTLKHKNNNGHCSGGANNVKGVKVF